MSRTKKLRNAFLILVPILLFVIVLAFIDKPMRYRLYPWDRITGRIYVEKNDQVYEIMPDNITAQFGTKATKVHANTENGSTSISVHAGAYGEYCISIEIDGIPHPLEIVCYQYNWWDICDFELSIYIDSRAETITIDCLRTSLNNEGEKVQIRHSSTLNLYDDVLWFRV